MAEHRTVTLTVSLTYEERKALKRLALDRDTNVSEMIREWLRRETSLHSAGRDGENVGCRDSSAIIE